LVLVGEAVDDLEGVPLLHAGELPVPRGHGVVGTTHEVMGPAAGEHLVPGEGRRPGRWTPELLELARVAPRLREAPPADRILPDDGQGQGIGILSDLGDGHRTTPFRVE